MLHLRELQVLRCVVLFIETERLWENWLITKTTFPPLDATCPARARKVTLLDKLFVTVFQFATTCDCHERTFCHVEISSAGP